MHIETTTTGPAKNSGSKFTSSDRNSDSLSAVSHHIPLVINECQPIPSGSTGGGVPNSKLTGQSPISGFLHFFAIFCLSTRAQFDSTTKTAPSAKPRNAGFPTCGFTGLFRLRGAPKRRFGATAASPVSLTKTKNYQTNPFRDHELFYNHNTLSPSRTKPSQKTNPF